MGTKSTTTTNESQKSEIDPELKRMYLQNYGEASKIGDDITQVGPYAGPRFATPTKAFTGDDGFDGAYGMTIKSANGVNRDIPENAPGATINRAEGWLNRAAGQPWERAGAYGYDPTVFTPGAATMGAAQSNMYNINRGAIRDQTAAVVPREQVRDVNDPTVPRALIRDINYGGVNRSGVRDVNAGTIASKMPAYETAYSDQVINRGLLDLDRARQMANGRVGDAAHAAGAFGGSRHGVAEAETNRGFADASARMIADERAKAFHEAGAFAGQDVAHDIAGQQSNQGADLNVTGMGQQGYLEAAKANQGADITAAGQRQAGLLAAGTANQGADLAMAGQYAQAGSQAQAGNQQMDYQTAAENARSSNAGGDANANRYQAANAANAGYAQQAGMAGYGAGVDALKFNASQKQAASAANQAASFQNISQMLQAAQQAQALAQQQYGMRNDASSRLLDMDKYGRGISQDEINAAIQAWDENRYRAMPGLQAKSGAIGMNLPNLGMSSTGSSKSTYQPSGMQTLGQIAGMAGIFI